MICIACLLCHVFVYVYAPTCLPVHSNGDDAEPARLLLGPQGTGGAQCSCFRTDYQQYQQTNHVHSWCLHDCCAMLRCLEPFFRGYWSNLALLKARVADESAIVIRSVPLAGPGGGFLSQFYDTREDYRVVSWPRLGRTYQ